MKISKTDAFYLIAKAMENTDEKAANEILNIISKSISNNTTRTFSSYIEINNKREIRILKNILQRYGVNALIDYEN